MTRAGALAAVVLAFALVAGSAHAVLGGQPDPGHAYVGAAELSDGAGGFDLCSGSLVSPTVFVTAAHCFPDGATVNLSFAEDASGGPSTLPLTGTVHNDPDFCLGCGNGLPGADSGDIAVVVLDTPVLLDGYAILPPVGLGDTLKNQQVDVVGYGVSGFSHKSVTSVGTREVATTQIKGKGALSGEFLKLQADPGACFGDSGGPDLVHGGDTMVAITSFAGGNPQCNGVNYSERLDRPAALEFIDGFLNAGQ